MVDYVKLAKTAKRLLEANGRPVTIIKLDQGSDDVAQPWRGKAEPRTTPADSADVQAVFVPLSSSIFLGLSTNSNDISRGFSTSGTPDTRRGNQVALVAANSATGKDLILFDEIVDEDGSRWKIVQAQLLKPASDAIMYAFEVKR